MASLQPDSLEYEIPASAPTSPKTSTDRPRSKSYTGAGHKKSPSASFFSKLPFFRPCPEAPQSPTPSADDVIPFPDVPDADNDDPLPRSPALAAVFDTQEKARKRKGSLRKTALLGTGRLRLDRRFSSAETTTKVKSPTKRKASDLWHRHDSSASANPRVSVDVGDNGHANSNPEDITSAADQLQLDTQTSSNAHASPATSPTGPYTSTTDEDDRFTIPSTVRSLSIPASKPSPSPSPPSSESSLTNLSFTKALIRSATAPTSTSPLAAQSSVESTDEWDYSTTEWWGWIILLVTWIVFVVGMGSCLEVWSWAWDVGETPYAPPELEDDPTLPIVGYYPALMVLTAVMSWVWVVVAWMGMKYFKHAKIQGDDT